MNLVLTDAAAAKLQDIVAEENNPELKLRISITGGGCSGFQYAFDLVEAAQADDFVVEKSVPAAISTAAAKIVAPASTVTMLVDPMSLMYLTGAEIDYKKTAAGEEFVIRNPNAKTTCGCGSSFSV